MCFKRDYLEMLPVSHYLVKKGSKFFSFLYFPLHVFTLANNECASTLKNKGDINIV